MARQALITRSFLASALHVLHFGFVSLFHSPWYGHAVAAETRSRSTKDGWSRFLSDPVHNARIAALSMANGAALAKLLRAHGRGHHAAALEAALSEVAEIVSTEVGRRTLSEAMSWVSDRVWNCETLAAENPTLN